MALTDLTRISTSGIATGTSLSGAILHGDAHFRGTQVGVTSALFDSSDDALEFNDNVKLKFGNSGNLQLYYDNSSYITNGTAGHLFIKTLNGGSDIRLESNDDIFLMTAAGSRNSIICRDYAQVELYHNNLKKFETTQTGAVVTGVLTATTFSGNLVGGGSGISTFYDLRVTNNLTVEGSTTTLDTNLIGVDRVEVGANSNSIVGVAVTQSGTADLVNLFDGATKVVTVDDVGNVGLGSAIPSAKLDVNGTSQFKDDVTFKTSNTTSGGEAFWDYSDGSLRFNDNVKVKFGNGYDFQIYHHHNENIIGSLSGSHPIKIQTKVTGSTENGIVIIPDGAVELYHNNVNKFETTSYGAIIDPDSSHTAASTSPARLSLGGTYSTTTAITTKPKLTLWENDSNNDAMGFQITGNLLSVHLSKTEYDFAIYSAGSAILTVDSGHNETNYSYNHDLNLFANSNKSGVIRFNNYNPAAAGPNKIILWEAPTWSGGFGVSTDHIDYYSGHTHCFYTGTTTSSVGNIAAEFIKNGAVDLYHNGSKKFQTSSTGVSITGVAGIDNTSSTSDVGLRVTNNSTSAFSTSENIEGTTNRKITPLMLRNGSTSGNTETYLGFDAGHSSKAQWNIGVKKTGSLQGDFIFNTRTGSSTSAERLRIDSSGRVGINSTAPRTYLQVSKGTCNYNPGNPTALNSANVVACFENSDDVEIALLSNNNKKGIIYFGDTDNTANSSIQYDHNVNHLFFTVNGGSERFRINNSGAFGLNGTNYGTSGQVITSGGTNSPVSWTTIPQTTINNNADNRLITGSGTANTLEAESTVTFDGTQFRVNAGHTSSIQVDGLYSYGSFAGVKIWRGAGNRSHNMGVGNNTLANASGGQDCTALGHAALQSSTSGSANTALGSHSMVGTVTGSNNVAVGHGSLNKLTSGYGNSVLGRTAGLEMLGGHSNTLMGYEAGYNITSGNSNAAFGYLALKTLTGNAGCVAVGSNALEVCTGADNCAVGFAAGQQLAGGTNNCLFGSSAGLMIQEGDHNIAIGRDALRMGSSGNVNYNVVAGNYSLNQLTNVYNNVVLGYNCSGSATMTGGTSWHSNVVIGYQAGNFVPSASSNIVIGKYTCSSAGAHHSDNIVMGTNAGKYLGNYSNNCVILGQEAAQNAGYGSGSNHAYSWTHSIAIGYRAFYNATGAPDAVVAMGSQALKEHNGDGDGSSGGYVVAVGNNCMSSNEHVRHTVAVGNDAGANWNPAKGNQHEGGAVFVGGGAGRYGGTAPSLIAIGRNAGQASSANPMSGPHNLCIGSRSGEKLRDGENNTVIGGNYCALFLQTGDWNTILGSLAGYAYDTNNSIQSGSYCTQIGGYTRSSGSSNDYENCFGYGMVGKGANTTHIRGNAYNSNNSSSWSTTSDERIKKNIVDNNIGLDAIEKIRVRNFEYRTQNEITDFDDPKSVVVQKEGVQLGVIAQEIKDVLPDVVNQNTTGAYSVDPDNLTWYLVNAVKELSAEVKSLKAQLNS